MRRFFLAALAAVLGVALVLPTRQAAAFEAEHADLQRRIAKLESLLEDVQEKVVQTSYMQPSSTEEAPMQTMSQPVYQYRPSNFSYPTANGVIAEFEAGFVKPFATNGDAPTLASAAQATNAANFGINAGTVGATAAYNAGLAAGSLATQSIIDFQVAPRITLGYQIPGGMGLRARYFIFDHTVAFTDGAANTLNQRLRLQTQDVETFGTLRRGRNSGTMFGGFRYADVTTASAAFNGGGSFTAQQITGGAGITGGITGTSVIGQSGNFTVNSGIRGSMLFGNMSASILNNGTGAFPVQLSRTTSMFSIWEVTLGSQYRRRLARGGTLLIGSSIEAQLWDGAGSLNPWVTVATTSANTNAAGTNGIVGTLGSFAALGFWNSFGLSF